MLAFLASLLPAGRGLRILSIVGGVVVLMALIVALKGCYDNSVVREEDAKREAAAATARESAAAERAIDDITIRQNEEKIREAIKAAPTGGALSPAARVLACERLRKRGNPPDECL